jgi:lipoprotein NlpD
MDGQVAYSGKDPSGSGNLVIVRHENSLLTAYSHCRDLYVAEGDSVRAGDPIGTLGWNSRQESVLRFEVRQDGNSLNPMNFLAAR